MHERARGIADERKIAARLRELADDVERGYGGFTLHEIGHKQSSPVEYTTVILSRKPLPATVIDELTKL